ncbi:MAG TPA: FAD-dependent monooxygenase, partial [Actinoplanes sp.]|nr:FAD-dependent monooxygenase [Actinoplanes sp.]
LVGADGVGSAVRRVRLPDARLGDTGTSVIYGKTPLDDATRRLVPPALSSGFTAITGGRAGLACGLVEFRRPPAEAAAEIAPDVRLSPAGDYVMWALSGAEPAGAERAGPLSGAEPAGMGSGAEPTGADAAALHAVAVRAIRSWHPDLRALLAAAAVDETFLIRIRSSRRVPVWAPSRVTLLGDAIHAMSPARGSGANTALMDAALLCDALTGAGARTGRDARTGGGDLIAAIGAYEARMRDYGFAAVEASRRAEAETARRGNPVGRWLLRHLPR